MPFANLPPIDWTHVITDAIHAVVVLAGVLTAYIALRSKMIDAAKERAAGDQQMAWNNKATAAIAQKVDAPLDKKEIDSALAGTLVPKPHEESSVKGS
jgi:hypothetical protein